jgi:hypothetical protein
MSPSFHLGLFCRVLVMPNRASQPGMAETRGLASSVLSVAPCHSPARLPDFPSTSPRPRAPPRPPVTPFHAPPCMANLVGVADVIMSTRAGLRPVALWHPHGTYTKGVCNGGPFGISPPTALPPKVRWYASCPDLRYFDVPSLTMAWPVFLSRSFTWNDGRRSRPWA